MPPRGQLLPEAKTESAKAARLAFFCELCQKGYSRMPEFEAHQGSYDHQHRQRLKDMRQMSRDPNAAAKAQQKANEEAGMKNINIALNSTSTSSGSTASGGGKKKPVFKSTLQPHNAAALGQSVASGVPVGGGEGDPSGAVRNGWFEERYQPRFVTGCEDPGCRCCERGIIDLGPAAGERDEVMGNA